MNDVVAKKVMLYAKDLKVSYASEVVLEWGHGSYEGNVIALIGHNGAGKSTFIKGLLGLVPNIEGELSVYLDKTQLRPSQNMAFCPEEGAVFADISVESYIRFWCQFKHGSTNYYKKQGERFIEYLNIPPLFNKLGRELSKGQRRRVQTAIGFLTEPDLFLFDEPFDGLDVKKTSELVELFQKEAVNTTYIVSSHRMDVVERIADVVIVLNDGCVAAAGSVSDVSTALAKDTYVLKSASNTDSLARSLRKLYPSALISRLGSEITVTGDILGTQALLDTAKSIDRNGLAVQCQTPNLVDAMNYYLKIQQV